MPIVKFGTSRSRAITQSLTSNWKGHRSENGSSVRPEAVSGVVFAPQDLDSDLRYLVGASPQQFVFVFGQHSRSGRGTELPIE